MIYSVKQLYTDADVVKAQIAAIGYPDIFKIPIRLELSNRMTRGLGFTTTNDYSDYTIKINARFVSFATHKQIMDTVAHELCHCLPYCFNHGKDWESVTKKLNSNFGYNIAKFANLSDSDAEKLARYKIVCEYCGKESLITRGNYITKYLREHPQQNHFLCAKCGSHKLKLLKAGK